jgi:hypothetical protein
VIVRRLIEDFSNPQTLSQFEAWVQQMQQRWSERFDALDTVLESEKKKEGE